MHNVPAHFCRALVSIARTTLEMEGIWPSANGFGVTGTVTLRREAVDLPVGVGGFAGVELAIVEPS